jgi:dolichol kinase
MTISYQQEVYRKLIHLSSLWMPVFVLFVPRWWCFLIFTVLLIGNMIIEYGHYRQWAIIHPIYHFFFGKMLRSKPPGVKFQFSGGPPVLAAAAMCTLLFPNPLHVFCALTVMLLSDAAAALIGRRWGRTRFSNGKTMEGSLAFVLVGWLTIIITGLFADFTGREFAFGIASIFLAALAECYTKKIRIDDNFSIPLIVGTLLTIAGWLN